MNITLTDRQEYIIKHALGLSRKPKGPIYRNFFSVTEGSKDFNELKSMENLGLLTSRISPFGESIIFHVTKEGAKAIHRRLPK